MALPQDFKDLLEVFGRVGAKGSRGPGRDPAQMPPVHWSCSGIPS